MMSSTTASKLPVSAARSAVGPSPTATTSMPSAVSPRATAVRTPGSSSTTSTRAIRVNLPVQRHRAPGSELSQHAMRSRCGAWQVRRRGRIAAAGRYGRRGRAGAARDHRRRRTRSPQLPPVTPEDLVELGARPPPTRARSTAPSSWTTTSACRRCPTRRRPPTARARPGSGPTATTRAGCAADRLRRAHPGLRRHDPLGLELRGPHGASAAPGRPSRDASARRPTTTAAQRPAIEQLRATSTVAVDGTARGGRPRRLRAGAHPGPDRAHAAARGARGRRRREADAAAADGARHRVDRAGPAGRLHRAELRPAGPGAVHLHPAARRDRDRRPGARRPAGPAREHHASATAGTPSGSCAGPPTRRPETAAPGEPAPRPVLRSARRSAAPGAADG